MSEQFPFNDAMGTEPRERAQRATSAPNPTAGAPEPAHVPLGDKFDAELRTRATRGKTTPIPEAGGIEPDQSSRRNQQGPATNHRIEKMDFRLGT